MTKRLVIENTPRDGRTFRGEADQLFSVWDSVRRVVVFLPWPGATGRAKALAFIAQGELDL